MASPGARVSAGYSRSTCRTMDGMDPRCPGLKSPWAIICPWGSNSPTEKSRPSRTAAEKAVRLRAVPASSAMERIAAHTTPRVMGSTRFIPRGPRSGWHTRPEPVPIVDRTRGEAARLGHVGPALALPGAARGLGAGGPLPRQVDLGGQANYGELPVGRLQRRAGRLRVAVAGRIHCGVGPADPL